MKRPLGLDATRVALPDGADRAAVLAALLRTPGVRDAVVAEATAAYWFDPDAPEPDVEAALRAPPGRVRRRTHTLPVRYDGPDLAAVAAWAGIAPGEVVERHLARVYTVHYLGFVVGFAYLGDVDPVIAAPRRATPRPRVPAGSVALAGARTAVYPGGTPGGWNLLGSCVSPLLARDGRPRLRVGDRVRFVPA